MNDERDTVKKQVWIDIINPSHPLFFNPVIKGLKEDFKFNITLRERGETVKLAKQIGIRGTPIGQDYEHPLLKTSSIAIRTLSLVKDVGNFDAALSFENPMSVAASKVRMKPSVLMLDNDLKYKIKGNAIQSLESKLKTSANYLIIPEACYQTFSKHVRNEKIITYGGYKEDVYIADHKPDPSILDQIPYDDYYVIRPEALASFYVESKGSLVPDLLKSFKAKRMNVVLLPRDKSDQKFKGGKRVHIPKEPLNGLDLIHYSSGVLTGSGTMAREAAVMGKRAVSFFPNRSLLSVDQDLIEKGRMIHSRRPKEIMKFLERDELNARKKESKKTKRKVLQILEGVLNE